MCMSLIEINSINIYTVLREPKMLLLCSVILIILFGSFSFYYLNEIFKCWALVGKIPGPKRQPILGHFMDLFAVDYATCFKQLRQWAQEYAPVYTLDIMGHVGIHIASAEDFEAIAGGMKNIEKSRIYDLLHRWLGSGLLTSTGMQWQTRRKILTPAFHFSSLQDFVKIFNEHSDEMIKDLKKMNLECVNVVPVMSNFTLKTIAEAAMGNKLDALDRQDNNFITATYNIGELIFSRIMRPWLYINEIYYNFTSPGWAERQNVNTLHTFCNRMIQNKIEMSDQNKISSGRKKSTMLEILLKSKEEERGIIDEEGIKDEVNTFMFEGHDTAAMSLSFTLMLLAVHKDVQETIYQEMLDVMSDNNYLNITDLNNLKYLERCIKESLRLYPSVPSISRNLEEDVPTDHDFLLPKGYMVFIDIFDIMRNKKYWPDPEKFDPNRFLPENCTNRHPFAYVPFSAGPRNCIGQKFAMLEIKVALCRILQNFKLEAIDTPETIEIIQDLVLRPNNRILNVKFVLRE